MGKIMQVTNKNTDFERGRIKLDLYETGFRQLSKVLGSVPSQTQMNASTGQIVGFEMFKDINARQWSLKLRCDSFVSRYNTWINLANKKVGNLDNFSYSFSSLTQNYSNYIKQGDQMDMFLMEKVVNPEKELDDFTLKGNSSMSNNLNELKEWSKRKQYHSCVNQIVSPGFQALTISSWKTTVNPGHGIGVNYTSRDKVAKVNLSNIRNIPMGTTVHFETTGETLIEPNDGKEVRAGFYISRTPLYTGDTEGKINIYGRYCVGDGSDGFSGNQGVSSWTGDHSVHFDTNDLTLPFLESRILI